LFQRQRLPRLRLSPLATAQAVSARAPHALACAPACRVLVPVLVEGQAEKGG